MTALVRLYRWCERQSLAQRTSLCAFVCGMLANTGLYTGAAMTLLYVAAVVYVSISVVSASLEMRGPRSRR